MHLRRGGKQTSGDGAGQLPIKLGRGVGHGRVALYLGRQERICCAGGRPRRLVRAQEPDGICREARGLSRTGNLDGRIPRLRSKKCFIESAIQ